MLRACRNFEFLENLAPPSGERKNPRTLARCHRVQVHALYKFPRPKTSRLQRFDEKKIFENFSERAMLRPLADDFRPNKNGFR
jgi:hypothetical protein